MNIGTLIDVGLVLLITALLFTVWINYIKNYHKNFTVGEPLQK